MATGCYVPTYYPASFKGVPFEALDVESEHGRRNAEGEFPFGEQTGYQDMGRKIRRFSVQGRFLENTHLTDAAALIAACESPGPGVLIHPARGLLMVGCTSLKVKDNPVDDGGITTFNAEFVEANDWLTGGFGILGAIVDILRVTTVLTSLFRAVYRPSALAFFLQARAVTAAQTALRKISAEIVAATVASTSTDHDSAWWVSSDLLAIAEDPKAMQDPDEVMKGISLGLVALASYTDASTRFAAMKRIANSAAGAVKAGGEVGLMQSAAATAVRTLAAVHMGGAIDEAMAATVGEGFRRLDQTTTILDDEISIARAFCHNELFMTLTETRDALRRSALETLYSAPAKVAFETAGSLHSLQAAYDLMGDAKRFREIERGNPGRLPWGMGRTIVSEVA